MNKREMIKDRKQSLTVKAILQEAFFYACIFTVPKFSDNAWICPVSFQK